MILEALSSSIAAVAALGTAEHIAAASALVVNVSALVGIRWIRGLARLPERREEAPELRDAA